MSHAHKRTLHVKNKAQKDLSVPERSYKYGLKADRGPVENYGDMCINRTLGILTYFSPNTHKKPTEMPSWT